MLLRMMKETQGERKREMSEKEYAGNITDTTSSAQHLYYFLLPLYIMNKLIIIDELEALEVNEKFCESQNNGKRIHFHYTLNSQY